MTLRLDPRRPVVWRDPATLQIGIDPPRVVLEHVTSVEERLIAALGVGVTRAGLDVVAGDHTHLVDPLLGRLTPALLTGPRGRPARVSVTGSGLVADLVVRLLASSGVAVGLIPRSEHTTHPDADPDGAGEDAEEDLAVIIARGVVAPAVRSRWLRRDTPHLAVVTSDAAVRVGPVIEPGHGPCLVCLERHRSDADPAWPAIASQLLRHPPVDPPAPIAAEAAALIARRVLDRLASLGPTARSSTPGRPTEIRIAAVGEVVEREVGRHPDCGCAELESGPSRSRALDDRAEIPALLASATGA
jgi:hypothetical protein